MIAGYLSLLLLDKSIVVYVLECIMHYAMVVNVLILQASEHVEMDLFLQEAINVAAKDWGLQCLRYEISELFFC